MFRVCTAAPILLEISMRLAKWLKKYGLKPLIFDTVDLRSCYMQQTPNRDQSVFIFKGEWDISMLNSPHTEICSLYYEKGKAWLKEHYLETRYFKLKKQLGKIEFPEKLPGLCDSIKRGYLSGDHKNDYIVVLKEPFAKSRYQRQVKNLVPEIFSGHHRVGALIASGQYNVPVMVAKDISPGLCFTNGKIHDACVNIAG
jgi:hypothetical protein